MKKLLTFLLLAVFSLSGYAQSNLYGDVNGDLEVNIADVNDVIEVILSDVNNPSADVNGDGEINITDINVLIDIILNGGIDPHFLEVCAKVAEVDQSVSEYYMECETLEEMIQHSDEIEALDNVEYVFSDGTTSLFVKIKNFGTISYSFFPDLEDSQLFNSERLLFNPVKPILEKCNNQIANFYPDFDNADVLIVNQAHPDDKSHELFGYFAEKLRTAFDFVKGLGFPVGFNQIKVLQPDHVEFYRDELFDYDYVYLGTHGEYEFDRIKYILDPNYHGVHWLLTSVEVPRTSSGWMVDKNELAKLCAGYDTQDVSYGNIKEKRGDVTKKVSYLKVSEHFIGSSNKTFNHPGKAIVFNTACHSMQGPRTNAIDSVSYSLARVFTDKGAGTYLGYDEEVGVGYKSGLAFWERLLSGMSIAAAKESLSFEMQHNHFENHWADLIMYSPENNQMCIIRPYCVFFNQSDEEMLQIDLNALSYVLYSNYGEGEGINDIEILKQSPLRYGFELSESNQFDNVVTLGEMRIGDENCSLTENNFFINYSQSLTSHGSQPDSKIKPNTTYWARAYVYDGYGYNYSEPITFTTGSISEDTQNHEWVDLGLPSGTLWATMNVGANSPEEYGDYFAWGETEPKDNYGTHKWLTGGKLTKYCTDSYCGYSGFIDNKTELDPEDDAAYFNWGPSWRMPSFEQIKELVVNCTWQHTTQNGVKGYLLTGPNGNTMFLPNTGYRLSDSFQHVGLYSYYWSRTLYSYNPNEAYYLHYDWSTHGRSYGFAVRAVRVLQEPMEFHLSETEVNLEVGESKTIFIINGNGSYSVENVGFGEVTEEFVGERLILTGVEAGNVDVIVTDDATNASATLAVTVTEPDTEHEYVDLGLPSGTLWATCNVGATTPEEYGDYFAWGETAPKDSYNWETYKWCNGSENTLTKYCTDSSYGKNGFVDYKTELDPEDDAAYVNWGPSWRMPTREQHDELSEKCTWTWTQLNGVDGLEGTGPNGNKLFLPAAGYLNSDYLNGPGSCSFFWSRTLDGIYPYDAYHNGFSNSYSWSRRDSDIRYLGISVRAVRRVSKN